MILWFVSVIYNLDDIGICPQDATGEFAWGPDIVLSLLALMMELLGVPEIPANGCDHLVDFAILSKPADSKLDKSIHNSGHRLPDVEPTARLEHTRTTTPVT